MDDDVELVYDGDGLAIVGKPKTVERFIATTGLASVGAPRSLGKGLRMASGLGTAAAEVAAGSGRWLKLTAESAGKLNEFGLTPTDTAGIHHAMLGQRGDIKGWLQVESGPASLVANPAMLSGAAGVMAQMAMQQAVDEIVDYLAIIDEKLDDLLRAQTNQILSRLDGIDLAVREAMSVRESVGRVSEVTWSKVQGSASRIHETQGYALRQWADLADKIERMKRVSDLAEVMARAETDVRSWLTVLARCFELHDQVAILELDRVMDSSPEELDRHRLGLRAAREERVAAIAEHSGRLLERMAAAAKLADDKVLFNPVQSPVVVRSTNVTSSEVHDFRAMLGVETANDPLAARPWSHAASEAWETVRRTGAETATTVRSAGSGAYDEARRRLSDARETRSGDGAARWRRRRAESDGEGETDSQ